MSTETQGIDAKGYLSGWLMALADMTKKDIRAIPDDQWNATHGGCSKSASSAIADTIGMLDWTTEALKGNVAEVEGSYISEQLKSDCSTKDGASAKLDATAQAFAAALGSATDESLNAIVTPPWKMDAPLFMLAQIAVSHVWYHDGQLNYIQSLLGDGEVHWMEP